MSTYSTRLKLSRRRWMATTMSFTKQNPLALPWHAWCMPPDQLMATSYSPLARARAAASEPPE
jgi:hypothetical protein